MDEEMAQSPLSSGTLAELTVASTATIQNQLFLRGLRHTVIGSVMPLCPERAGFVGEAFTLRYIPAREDLDTVASFKNPAHPQRLAIETIDAGQVLVVDSRQDGSAASAGEILMTRLACRGAAAFVTDGSVRDSPRMAQIGLPVYASSVTPTTNLVKHHAVDMQVPIGCGGVAVFPGDIIVGDAEGVVVIPRGIAAEVAADAAQQEKLEEFLLAKVQAGAPLPGTYPLSDEVRAEYQAHLDGK